MHLSNPVATSQVPSRPYKITIQRMRNPAVGDAVSFILIVNGRPRPLADGATITLEWTKQVLEIPVLISKNAKSQFEGILTGTSNGEDISITWYPDLTNPCLGTIKEASNSTIHLEKKPGATRW